jgi:deoxyribonuclease V
MIPRHRWDLPPKEARILQSALAGRVIAENRLGRISRVAGVDAGPVKGTDRMRAAVVVLDFPSLTEIDSATVETPVEFPYVPGLLSFREGPAVLAAYERLTHRPDVFIFDGQGLAHPRRFGIACHLGLLMDRPAIGCAKSRLCGFADAPGPRKGSRAPLVDKGEVVGMVLRTRENVSPVYVSIGHKIDLSTAVEIVLACCPTFRLPETTRRAHRLASKDRRPASS